LLFSLSSGERRQALDARHPPHHDIFVSFHQTPRQQGQTQYEKWYGMHDSEYRVGISEAERQSHVKDEATPFTRGLQDLLLFYEVPPNSSSVTVRVPIPQSVLEARRAGGKDGRTVKGVTQAGDVEGSDQWVTLQLILLQKNFPVHILTKSTLVERDIDILKKISKKTKCIVSFSFSSVDEKISSIFEPGVPSPKKRLDTIEFLKNNGIDCGIFLLPVYSIHNR
jgi:hypothetical protein